MCAEFTMAELEAESGELVPAREALALVDLSNINNLAVNTAIAINLFTEDSIASAEAKQFLSNVQH